MNLKGLMRSSKDRPIGVTRKCFVCQKRRKIENTGLCRKCSISIEQDSCYLKEHHGPEQISPCPECGYFSDPPKGPSNAQ